MLYRPKAEYIEAWQWAGQPESEWPEWLGPPKALLANGTIEHGWYFVRNHSADRANAVPQKMFERDYELVSQ